MVVLVINLSHSTDEKVSISYLISMIVSSCARFPRHHHGNHLLPPTNAEVLSEINLYWKLLPILLFIEKYYIGP